MTEHDELNRRVCLAPDEDLPRLIYADWCDGNGGHRWYLGHGNIDEAMCDECLGTGWRTAE